MDSLPNLWKEITTIDEVTTCYSLLTMTLRMLQLIVNMGDLWKIDYDKDLPLGKPDTWLNMEFTVKEPQLRCLIDSTMMPMIALQLKTIASMGWMNLEFNNEIHYRRLQRHQFDKQRDYIKYSCIQQILLLNWLYEVLTACQAEFYNYGLIRNHIKYCEGYTSMAIGLATIVEYNLHQEVHAEHGLTKPKGRMDENMFLGL